MKVSGASLPTAPLNAIALTEKFGAAANIGFRNRSKMFFGK
jgi:hypothetical protein